MKKYRFKAAIQASDGGGAFVFFPFDVEKEFGVKGKVPVKASIDGVSYTGSLFKYGHSRHMFPVLKAIREKMGKGPGDSVHVEIWKDEEVRTLDVPASFAALLKTEGLLATFERLSHSHRREYCRWIAGAKKEETRMRRAAKAVEMLDAGVKTPG